ncbi:hypothetical protein AB4Z19_20010 [Pseudoduganella sp. RAF19]|jgi:hypothetical protein|uniref:hypothetical protein n=1 Tax=Pseudoduganella sp. RAF19 TaxID=3233052 RepID=UPI003F9BE34C
MRINDTWRGVLILAALVVALFLGAIALTDNGAEKVSCVGRAIAHGISFTNIHSVCNL